MRATGLRPLIIGPYPLQEGKIVGGVEAATHALALSLAQEEAIERVTVLRFHTGQVVNHRTRVSDKLHIWYIRGQARLKILTRLLWQVAIARHAAAEIRPHVIHGQGIGNHGDVATQVGGPSVVTVHGLIHLETRLDGQRSLKNAMRNYLVDTRTKQVLRRAKAVISISAYDSGAIADFIKGRHFVIPNAIASDFFAPSYHPPTPHQVLFAGVLMPRKNAEGLVRAFALVRQAVPSARLVVVGPNPDRDYAEQVRNQVQESNLSDCVDFVGHVEHEQLLQAMRTAQVVALFSNEETLPTVLAQAMAMRKPIVSSKVGGVGEMVIDGESGLLVAPRDEQGFAKHLITLLNAPELCTKMGERGHAIAQQQFESASIARRTIDVYRAVSL